MTQRADIDDFQARVTAALDQQNENILELNARLSAQALLLEIVYANEFADIPESFQALMDALHQSTAQRPVRQQPMSDEYALELQARIATHLQRFGTRVMQRLT